MWAVLISGAVLVVVTSYLSGNEQLLLHCFHVLSISFLILLMLTAMADLARPFEGGTSLEPVAFREAYTRMATAVDPISAQ
jgi:predicted membrane protein